MPDTRNYNIIEGCTHALADPAVLDGYTGPCWFAVDHGGNFQWYPGTILGAAPGEARWTIEHVGSTVTRGASHILIPAVQCPRSPV